MLAFAGALIASDEEKKRESMNRSRSEPYLHNSRRHVLRDQISVAIPNYVGHIPGARTEEDVSFGTFSRNLDACRQKRSRATFDPQDARIKKEDGDRLARSLPATVQAPVYDKRGTSHPVAGDTAHSRVPESHEERVHFQSDLGLTSLAHENRGGFGRHRGYQSATKGIPGFTGHIPGKNAENIFADGWSKTTERSVANHLTAVRSSAKEATVLTAGGTVVAPHPSDMLGEVPIFNPSYQDRTRGWSNCEFTGKNVEAAGRLAPKNRQEGFNGLAPPASRNQIHGYAGWVPGRVGESVVGERQCKTNDISDHLFRKNRMRITQR